MNISFIRAAWMLFAAGHLADTRAHRSADGPRGDEPDREDAHGGYGERQTLLNPFCLPVWEWDRNYCRATDGPRTAFGRSKYCSLFDPSTVGLGTGGE